MNWRDLVGKVRNLQKLKDFDYTSDRDYLKLKERILVFLEEYNCRLAHFYHNLLSIYGITLKGWEEGRKILTQYIFMSEEGEYVFPDEIRITDNIKDHRNLFSVRFMFKKYSEVESLISYRALEDLEAYMNEVEGEFYSLLRVYLKDRAQSLILELHNISNLYDEEGNLITLEEILNATEDLRRDGEEI